MTLLGMVLILQLQNFLDNYGRSLRSTGRIRQAFQVDSGRVKIVKNGERVVSNQHIRDMSLVDLLQNKYDLNDREDLSRILAMFKHCAASRGDTVPRGHPQNYEAVQSLGFSWDSSVTIPTGGDLAAEQIDCYEDLIEAQFPVADEDEAELVHSYEEFSEFFEDSEPDEHVKSVKPEPLGFDRLEDQL